MHVDGRDIAEKVLDSLREKHASGARPVLGIVSVGDDPASESFIRIKKRAAASLNIKVHEVRFDEDVLFPELYETLGEMAEFFEGTSAGIVLQLPLPLHLNVDQLTPAIPNHMDVDILSPSAYARWKRGSTQRVPPVVGAVRRILRTHGISLANKKVVVIGKGRLTGMPVHDWLDMEKIPHTVIDETIEGHESVLRRADVLMSGTGVPGLITPRLVKKGAILIDMGTSNSEGVLCGDIDILCAEQALLFTPTPGGVGPVTVAELMNNLFIS